MNKYLSRITSSQRGEKFNPLIWPFQLATFAYAIGFTFLRHTAPVQDSSLYQTMYDVWPVGPLVWGITAIVVIVCGFSFLLFRIPPFGKISGFVGFILWLFAAVCYAISGGFLALFSVAIPNMIFWFWQYLSLVGFRREDAEDKADDDEQSRQRAKNQRIDEQVNRESRSEGQSY